MHRQVWITCFWLQCEVSSSLVLLCLWWGGDERPSHGWQPFACKGMMAEEEALGVNEKVSIKPTPCIFMSFSEELCKVEWIFKWVVIKSSVLNRCSIECVSLSSLPLSVSCVCTAACYLEIYVTVDRLTLLLLSPSLSCFFSVLGWPALVFVFSPRTSPLKRDGEERNISTLRLCASRYLRQLCLTLSLEQRGCSRFFSIFHYISSSATVTFIPHLINHTAFILYSFCISRWERPGFSFLYVWLFLCTELALLNSWMTDGISSMW